MPTLPVPLVMRGDVIITDISAARTQTLASLLQVVVQAAVYMSMSRRLILQLIRLNCAKHVVTKM